MRALGHQHSWTTTDMMMCSCGVMCGMHMIEDTVFFDAHSYLVRNSYGTLYNYER